MRNGGDMLLHEKMVGYAKLRFANPPYDSVPWKV